MRTRFFCCLMFGISKGCPPPDGRAKGSRASPYAPGVDEEQRARERDARRQAREERRRAQGRALFPVDPAASGADGGQTLILPREETRGAAERPPGQSLGLQRGEDEPQAG